jgi:hypothetical protein
MWHEAEMAIALTHVRFRGRAEMGPKQPFARKRL